MTAPTIASLGLSIDSSPAKTAKGDLDNLTAAAQRTETATKQLGTQSAAAATHQAAAAAAAQRYTSEQTKSNQAVRLGAISAGQYSNAMRMLPLQLTDVVTQLASGQAAWQIFIQQGGQIRDSFGGVGNSVRALLSVLTPLRVAIGAGAAAAIAFSKAFFDGQRETFDLTRAIVLSGNAAGVTAGQLHEMAKAMDGVSGTRSQAAAALSAAVSTGRIAADQLKGVAEAALQLERVGGAAMKETIADFAALGAEPVAAAERLQKKYNFLTVAIYDQIRALARAGDTAAAAALAQDTFATTAIDRAATLRTNLGYLQTRWFELKDAARQSWDAMLNLGREDTLDEKIKDLEDTLRRGTVANAAFTGRTLADVKRDLEALKTERAALNREAEAAAQSAKDLTAKQLEQVLAPIRIAAAGQSAVATLQAQVGQVERTQSAAAQAVEQREQLLEARRSAHLIGEKAYYDERRKLVEQDRDVHVRALQAQERLLAAEAQRIRQSGAAAAAAAEDPAGKLRAELAIQPQLIANEEKRRDLKAQINLLTTKAVGETKILNEEETGAARQLEISFKAAEQAAQSYLDTIRRRNELEIEGLGLGERARDQLRRRSEVELDFERQRQELERDRLTHPDTITQEVYDRRLQIINASQKKALDLEDDYQEKLGAKQGDWLVGAKEALNNYIDQARNTAALTDQAFTNTFNALEDSIVRFVQTGKFSFKDLANTIIIEIARIEAKMIASNIAGFFGDFFKKEKGLGSLIPGFAAGGSLNAGQLAVVGERGPELFVPRVAGNIVPNERLGRSGDVHVTNYVRVSGDGVTHSQVIAAMEQTQKATIGAMFQLKRSGQF